ncbi:MAG: hypothetical protein AMXMBFR13_03460 [Phycisphaerae bacterium]
MGMSTSPRLAAVLSGENFVLRDDLQQDKRAALLSVARLFKDHGVPYVVVGGLAVQLYDSQTRPTVDVDLVSLRDPFRRLRQDQPWSEYGFELVFDRRRYVKIRHLHSNVEVDINLDTRFARVLDSPTVELIDGEEITFCSVYRLAFTKLRTQRSDWPRDPVKRVQDRGDLMSLLRAYPAIAANLRQDELTTDEMRQILEAILEELRTAAGDELPGEDVPG